MEYAPLQSSFWGDDDTFDLGGEDYGYLKDLHVIVLPCKQDWYQWDTWRVLSMNSYFDNICYKDVWAF